MQFYRHKRPKARIVFSEKAQIVLGINEGDADLIRQAAALRDEYLRRRDAESINRITMFEIEHMGVDAALSLALSRGSRRVKA